MSLCYLEGNPRDNLYHFPLPEIPPDPTLEPEIQNQNEDVMEIPVEIPEIIEEVLEKPTKGRKKKTDKNIGQNVIPDKNLKGQKVIPDKSLKGRKEIPDKNLKRQKEIPEIPEKKLKGRKKKTVKNLEDQDKLSHNCADNGFGHFSPALERGALSEPLRKRPRLIHRRLEEKLEELYSQFPVEGPPEELSDTHRKYKPRFKEDYIEKYVKQNNLNYFIVKVYPKKMRLFIKNQYRTKMWAELGLDDFKQQVLILDTIDYGEIPRFLNDLIVDYPWTLLYDYHCFLLLEKYSSEVIDALPIFTTFILLEPTASLFIYLVNKKCSEHMSERSSEIAKLSFEINYESDLSLTLYGPLYLKFTSFSFESVDFLFFFDYLIGSDSSDKLLRKHFEVALMNEDALKSFIKPPFYNGYSEAREKYLSNPSNIPKEKYTKIAGSCVPYLDLKSELQSCLVKRSVVENFRHVFTSQVMILVEVFEVTVKRKFTSFDYKDDTDIKRYLSIFWKNNKFYAALTFEEYRYQCCERNDSLFLLGDRKSLDRYILKLAQVMSSKFTKFLVIKHRDTIWGKETLFFREWNNAYKSTDPSTEEWRDSANNQSHSEIISSPLNLSEGETSDSTGDESDTEMVDSTLDKPEDQMSNSAHAQSNYEVVSSPVSLSEDQMSDSDNDMSGYTHGTELGDDTFLMNFKVSDPVEELRPQIRTCYFNAKPDDYGEKTVTLSEKECDEELNSRISGDLNAPSTSTFGLITHDGLYEEMNIPGTSPYAVQENPIMFGALNEPSTTIYGMGVPSTSTYGIDVPCASTYGIGIPSASAYGMDIPNAPVYGMNVPSTSTYGIDVPNVSTYGMDVPCASAYGMGVQSSSPYAMDVQSSSPYAMDVQSSSPYALDVPGTSQYGMDIPCASEYNMGETSASAYGLSKASASGMSVPNIFSFGIDAIESEKRYLLSASTIEGPTKEATDYSFVDIIKSDVFNHVFKPKNSSEGTHEDESSSPHLISVGEILDHREGRSIFEAHPFENVEKCDLNSCKQGEKNDLCPSLKTPYTFSRNDLLKTHNHNHSDDVMTLLKSLMK